MRDRRIRFLWRSFSHWLLGALAISILLSSIDDNLFRFYHLKHEGVRTNGVVTKLEPGNHQAVYYSYEAAGEIHSGSGMAGFGNPEFCCLRVGQKVIVYYLRTSPATSCIGIPDELIKNEATFVALAAIMFPIFAILGFSYRIPLFKQWLLA